MGHIILLLTCITSLGFSDINTCFPSTLTNPTTATLMSAGVANEVYVVNSSTYDPHMLKIFNRKTIEELEHAESLCLTTMLEPQEFQPKMRQSHTEGSITSMPIPSFRLAVESVIRYGEKVLLTKRAEGIDVAPGVWNVPAGKVKLLEVTADAAQRETLEEVGFAVRVVGFLEERTALIQSRGEPAYRNIFTYLTEPVEENPKVILNEEHSEYRWVSSDELCNPEFSSLLPKLREIIQRVLNHPE